MLSEKLAHIFGVVRCDAEELVERHHGALSVEVSEDLAILRAPEFRQLADTRPSGFRAPMSVT